MPIAAGMDTTSSLPHSVALLALAWPEAIVDPVMAAKYESALVGLDSSTVGSVVGSLSGAGRSAPTPGILRTVILARQAAATNSGLTLTPQRMATAAGGVAGARTAARPGRPLVPMIVAGLATSFAAATTGEPWVRLSAAGRTFVLTGRHVDGGPIVRSVGPLALLVAAIGVFYVWRRRSARQIGSALGLLAAVATAAVFGCIRGLLDARDAGDQFTVGVTVSVESGLWSALVLSAIGFLAAVYGLVTLRRGTGAARR